MKYSMFLSMLLVASVSLAATPKKKNKKVVTPQAAASTSAASAAQTSKSKDALAPAVNAPATAAPKAETPSAAPISTTSVQAPTHSQITGLLEFRPTGSYKGKGNWTTENTVGLGYKPNADTEFGYIQYWATNLNSPDKSRTDGKDMMLDDGFFRLKMSNLYKNDSGFSFGYEPRVYLPTASALRDAGLIVYNRNYLKFSQKVSNVVTLVAYEIPVLHFYSRAGNGVVANPGFENRVYLEVDLDLGKGFSLSVPLMFHQKKYRNYSPLAANNSKWDFFVWTWPELDYELNKNLTLGIAWRSENFVKGDLSALTLSDGIGQGVVQAVVSLSL